MGERIKITEKKPLSTKENSAPHKQKTGFQSQNSHVDRILFLQRTIGNQAIQRLIKSGTLQAILRIGQPGDKYEQEADRVADAVMRMPEPEMQRQVDEEEEEEILQTKPLVDQITPVVQRQVEEEEEEEMLQAKNREDATPEVTNDLESQINAIKGGGRPLAESERSFFEPRFGHDFREVRVHTNAQAEETARAVNARAFTVGQDVMFGTGQYSPDALDGRKLLAHELTHVIQQQHGRRTFALQKWGIRPLTIVSVETHTEQELADMRARETAAQEAALANMPDVMNMEHNINQFIPQIERGDRGAMSTAARFVIIGLSSEEETVLIGRFGITPQMPPWWEYRRARVCPSQGRSTAENELTCMALLMVHDFKMYIHLSNNMNSPGGALINFIEELRRSPPNQSLLRGYRQQLGQVIFVSYATSRLAEMVELAV